MLKRIFTGLYHFIWYAFAFIVLNAAVLVTVVRLALPEIGEYKDEIQSWVSEYMDYPVVIDEISAEWQGWTPNLYLKNIDLYTQDSSRIITKFKSAHLGVDLIASLAGHEIVPSYLSVSGLDLEVSRHIDGSISISSNNDKGLSADTDNSAALSGWLLKQKHIILENSKLAWNDEKSTKEPKQFSNVQLELKTHLQRVQLGMHITLPEQYGQSLSMKMDVTGNILTPDWSGAVYIEAEEINPTDLLDNLPVKSVGGSANLKLWTSWKKAKLTDFNGEIDYTGFSLNTDKYNLPVNNISIILYGERKENRGWLLNVNVEDLQTFHSIWPSSNYQLKIEEDDSGDNYRYSGYLSFLKLEEALPFIIAADIIPDDILQKLHWQSIKGELTDLDVNFDPDSKTGEIIRFDSTFKNLDIVSHDKSHYISGLEGTLTASNNLVKIQLDSKFPEINFGSLYDQPHSLSEINANLELVNNDSIELLIKKLDIVSNDISINSSGKIRFDEQSPFIDVVVHLDETSIENIPTYLPKQTKPKLKNWLTRALVGGRILSGDIIYRGHLTNFPFNNSEGNFKAILNIGDATLDYLEDWPPVDDLTAEVVIDNDDLTISSNSGYIFDAKIKDVSAEIKNLSKGNHHVIVNGSINGHTSDARNFIVQSPLNKNPSLSELTNNIAGSIDLELSLDIPLGHDKTIVEGLISFADTTIESRLPGLGLEDVNGDVNFTRNEVWASDIDALYYGRPVKLNIPKIDRYKSEPERIEITGLADEAFILNQLAGFFPSLHRQNNNISNYFSGESKWTLSLKKSITDSGTINREVELNSDLNGIAINLPIPFGKKAEETRQLNIKTGLKNLSIDEININYDSNLFADFIVDNTHDLLVKNTFIGFGQQHPKMPISSDISVQGKLEQLNLSEWIELINLKKLVLSQKSNTSQSQTISGDIHVRELRMIDNNFNNVYINLGNPHQDWELIFDGEEIRGQAQFVKAENNKNDRLHIDLEKLSLHKSDSDNNDKQTAIDNIPELEINIDKFTYNDNELGQVTLQTSNLDNGININNLSIIKPGLSIKANGEWTRIDEIDRSDFNATLEADSIESMLSTFNYNTANIKDGQTTIEMKANWFDTPMNFSMENINGKLDMQIGKGQFLDIDPYAGRLFGLLSLQTLPRRLSLDFTDLFNEGFAFDSIKGNFSMDQGHAYTNDLEMKGPAADIIVSGRTGFITEDYDQIATITPKVSNSLPVASALFGPIGVGVGAVIYLTGELFKSIPKKIDEILRYQYSITGSWDNPNIEKIKKDSQSG
jgi:uncharacterized protein (TIGR02099 family)